MNLLTYCFSFGLSSEHIRWGRLEMTGRVEKQINIFNYDSIYTIKYLGGWWGEKSCKTPLIFLRFILLAWRSWLKPKMKRLIFWVLSLFRWIMNIMIESMKYFTEKYPTHECEYSQLVFKLNIILILSCPSPKCTVRSDTFWLILFI